MGSDAATDTHVRGTALEMICIRWHPSVTFAAVSTVPSALTKNPVPLLPGSDRMSWPSPCWPGGTGGTRTCVPTSEPSLPGRATEGTTGVSGLAVSSSFISAACISTRTIDDRGAGTAGRAAATRGGDRMAAPSITRLKTAMSGRLIMMKTSGCEPP